MPYNTIETTWEKESKFYNSFNCLSKYPLVRKTSAGQEKKSPKKKTNFPNEILANLDIYSKM